MPTPQPNDIQHGGSHYKGLGNLEPWDVIHEWGLGFLEGTMLKRIQRWRNKGGVTDLRKILHEADKYVEQNPDHDSVKFMLERLSWPAGDTRLLSVQRVASVWKSTDLEKALIHCLSPGRPPDWINKLKLGVSNLIQEELAHATVE